MAASDATVNPIPRDLIGLEVQRNTIELDARRMPRREVEGDDGPAVASKEAARGEDGFDLAGAERAAGIGLVADDCDAAGLWLVLL